MLKFAKKYYGSDLMSFYYMDAEGEIPKILRHHQFDIVSSFYCLHWIKDLKSAFQNIHKLLKTNGLFCCVFLQSTRVNDIWDNLSLKYPLYMKDWRSYYTPLWSVENANNLIEKYLEDCNFKIVKFYDIRNENFKFKNVENYTSRYA
jgi:juvenile hormone acid methyltransferase